VDLSLQHPGSICSTRNMFYSKFKANMLSPVLLQHFMGDDEPIFNGCLKDYHLEKHGSPSQNLVVLPHLSMNYNKCLYQVV
jgi:hypothetical protein